MKYATWHFVTQVVSSFTQFRLITTAFVASESFHQPCFLFPLQSLFQIPVFQAEILSYSPPEMPSGTTSHSQCVTFVLELQKIFVLLLKSDRMYIDPSPAILVSWMQELQLL